MSAVTRRSQQHPTRASTRSPAKASPKSLTAPTVVVDVSNSPDWEDEAVMQFFQTSSRNLLAAEAAAGVGHHVALSVVGTDRLTESGYFRAKLAQEELIEGSSIPYSIVHATQFFEFMNGIADQATDGNAVRLPPALIQPMAADDVASAVARVAVGPAAKRDWRSRDRKSSASTSSSAARYGAQRSSRGDNRPARALLRHRGQRAHPPPRRWREIARPISTTGGRNARPGPSPRPPQSRKAAMHEIRVSIVSPEAADHGVAELWAADKLVGYTILEDSDLMLRIEPRRDRTAVVVGAHSLAQAIGRAEHLLARY